MKQPEFDEYAKRYDEILGDTIPEGLNEDGYFAEYKIAIIATQTQSAPPRRILDFGCGAGRSLPYLAQYFPESDLWGYDVSPASLKIAAARVPKAQLFSDWSSVSDVHFDCIVAANVFHHILPPMRPEALKRCHRALTPDGSFFLFEHNPLNPATKWIFERCPFDVDAEMLSLRTALKLTAEAGFSSEQHAYTLFFPRPLAFLRRLEPLLARIPLGAQYYVRSFK